MVDVVNSTLSRLLMVYIITDVVNDNKLKTSPDVIQHTEPYFKTRKRLDSAFEIANLLIDI